ncbi:MAG: hypothetical protein ACI9F9_003152 [Candidatus Paceibacteria bacterium]|jgi:hypothetical protein
MEITNKTKRPLRIPLPGGKKLHLGPGKTGQITPKASEHPPVLKLVEAGELELLDKGRKQGTGGSGGNTGTSASKGAGGGGMRHTGDR